MTRPSSIGFVLSALLVAYGCGGAAEPAPAPAAPPPVTTAPPVAAAPAPEPVKVAEPTPEEKKKAEDAKALREERAKWEEDHKAEVARWTPELHSEAKALADKTYPSGKAAISAMLAGKHRKPGAADRDKYRHPIETLEFFGFKPNMTVVDVGPGEGYYTELLAPVLAKSGKYVGTSADPNGPPEVRSTFYAQRFKAFLEKAPEAYGKAQTVVLDSKAPKLGMDGKVDLVLIMRGVHGMKTGGTLSGWLAEIHRAL